MERRTAVEDAEAEESVGGWRSPPGIVGESVSTNWWVSRQRSLMVHPYCLTSKCYRNRFIASWE
ncbi:hypothetical protein ACFLTC_02340, partial [Chloroflexota bacterium]